MKPKNLSDSNRLQLLFAPIFSLQVILKSQTANKLADLYFTLFFAVYLLDD
jgi:hypothetical protein